MVNIGGKKVTHRKAIAEGRITMASQTLEMIKGGNHKKGDVLSIARIAGIMAAKRTADLVPLCHPILLTGVNVNLLPDTDSNSVYCQATTETSERTGVEMEALTAVQITLLTIYDMCKAVDREMEIVSVRLIHKSGGKNREWNRVS